MTLVAAATGASPGKENATGQGLGSHAGVLVTTIQCRSPPDNRSAMSPSKAHEPPQAHGDVLTVVSDGMVGLLKEFYGNGPTGTKSYYHDDLVVCVLRGGFSRVEQTLLDGGRGSAVIQQRMEFQEVMRGRFTDVIEYATGRPVIGFMSGNQQDPDLMCEVFILGPSDLVDEHEIDGAAGGSRVTS